MAISVASLTASLSLDSGNFQSGLSNASGSLSKFASGAQGHAASIEGAMGGIGAKAVALGGIMANLATGAISGLAGAFSSLQQGMIGGNAEFERYETQFGVLLGSAGAAKDRLKELADFGASTPFELPEVVRADKILQGFGLHATDTAKKFGMSGAQIRTVAGDVASGTGAKFEEIAGYLGKFSTGATGEAIARMQELGITTRAELASMGVAFSKSGEMTSPVEVGMSALLQVMQTKFGGMMQAQSSTFEGMMSNLQDWAGQAQRIMGGPIFDALKGQLSGLLQVLGSGQVQAALQSIGQSLGSAFAMLGPAIQGAIAQIGPALSSIASGLNGAVTTVQTAITTIQGAVASAQAGFAAAGAGGAAFNLLTALGIDPGIANTIATTIGNIVSAVQGAFTTLQSAIQSAQQGLAAGPGVATINFLTALGLDEGTAAQIGVAVANISAAIQAGISTIKSVVAAFQTGGVAGGATALLQSLGLDPAIVGAAQALFALLVSAVQGGIDTIKSAIAGFQSGGVTGLLQAIGVDPATIATVTGVFSAIQGTISNALSVIAGVIGSVAGFIVANWQTIAVAVGTAAAAFGVLNVVVPILGAIAGAVGLLLSPLGLIAAAVGVLAAAWVSNFGNIQGIVGAVLPILGTLAGIVAGVLVGAFNALGAIVGFVAGHWQVFAAAAGAVVAVLAGSGLAGIITTIIGAVQGLSIVIASAGGVMGVLQTALAAIAGAFALPAAPILVLVGIIGALAVAWATNMGGIQGKTSEFIQQVIANFQQLAGYIGAFGQFLQTPITQIGQGWSTLQERIGQVNTDFQANLANIAAAHAETAASASASMGQMGESASTTGQIVQAVMAGNFGAIPGIVSAAIGGANQSWTGGLTTMVANTQQAAFSIRSLMASIQGMSQQASLAAAQNSAAPSDANTERALIRLEAQGKTVDQVQSKAQQIAAKAAEATKVAFNAGQAVGKVPTALNTGAGAGGGGGSGGSGGGLKSVEDKIQAAAETISKVTDTVMKLKEALSNGLAGIMEGSGSDTITQAAAALARLGRSIYEEFAKAAVGLSEDSNKGAQALAQGISSATGALNSLIGMLPKLMEFLGSDAWAEISAAPGAVVAAASQIIQLGKAISDAFTAAMGNVSDETAKSAQNGAAVVGAAAQAMNAMVGMLPKLWEFINDPAFDEIMAAQGEVVNAATKIIQLGKAISDAFLGAMGNVSDETAKAAQNGAAVIGAATQSISSIIDTVKKIVDFTADAGYAAALFSDEGRANILRAADLLIGLGVDMFNMFTAAASGISTKAAASAKRLGEGLQSMGQGITAVVDVIVKMGSWLQDGMNAVFSVSPRMQTDLVALATLMSDLGAAMLVQFGGAGAKISSLTVAAAKRLGEGIQAASGGITATVDLIVKFGNFIQDGMNAVFSVTPRMQRDLVALSTLMSVLARGIYEQWLAAASTVSQYHVEAAKRLAEGIKAAADGITATIGVVIAMLHLMGDSAQSAAVRTGQGRAALIAFAHTLSTLARDVYDTWVASAASTSQYHVEAAKRLADGIKAASDGIAATLAVVTAFIQSSADKAVTAATTTFVGQKALIAFADTLSRIARDIYDTWVTAAASVSQYHVDAAKRLAEGIQAASTAITTTRDLVVMAVDAMTQDWPAMDTGPIVGFIAGLVRLGMRIADAVNDALGAWTVEVKPALANLVTVLQNSLNAIDAVMKLAGAVAVGNMAGMTGSDLAGQGPGGYSPIQNRIIWLVMVGKQMAQAANDAIDTWSVEVRQSLADLGTVLQNALSVIESVFKIVEAVAVGNMKGVTGSDFAQSGMGGYSPIQNRIIWLIMVGQKLAEAARDAMGSWSITVPAAMADLKTVLSDSLGIIQDTFGIISNLSGENYPDLSDGALTTIKDRLVEVLNAGKAIADRAVEVATGWRIEVNPVMTDVGTVLGRGLEIISKTLDIVGQLGGEKFPDVTGAALTTIKDRLTQVLTAGKAIADQANTVATNWTMTVNPVMTTVGTVLGSGLEIVSKTLDIVGQLSGDKFPSMTGAALVTIKDRLGEVLAAGKAIADKANEVATGWTMTVNPVMTTVGTVLGNGLEIVSKTLDIVGQLGGDKFPPLTGAALVTIKDRLTDVLTAGKAMADKAVEVATGWTMVVNPVMTTVGTVLAAGLEIVSKTLDIVGQLGGDKFPPLTGDALAKILVRLTDTLNAGKAMANTARTVATAWEMTVNPVMVSVGTVLSQSLEIVSKTLDIVGQLSGDKFPPLTGDALARLLVRFENVLNAGKALANTATNVAREWTMTVNPVMVAVGTVLGQSLEIVSKTLDIVGQLGGDKFPPLTGAALTRLVTRFEDVLNAGKALADKAASVATAWTMTVNPAMTAVGTVLSNSLDIIGKTLDIVGQLGGDKFPTLDTSEGSPLLTRLGAVLKAGKDIADKAAAVAAGWALVVPPAMANVGKVLADSLDIIGKTLDIASQLGGEKFPPFDTAMMGPILTRLADVLRAGKDIADRAVAVANGWSITINPAMETVSKALSEGLGIIKNVLEFNDLKATLVSFRPLDMAVFGPKLDLIFLAAKDLAQKFAEKARAAGITKDMQDAADALAKVFGDAAGAIKGALDMAAQLLDPATQIPSIGQIEGKLTAILNLVGEVTTRFAAKAASIGPDTAKSAEGLSGAVKSVFDAISQVIKAVQDAAGLYLGTSGFNNIATLLTYLFDTFDQFAGRAEGVNAVTAAITSLLGGIQALTADAGTASGASWAQQFAAAVTANAGLIRSAISGALTTPTGQAANGGGGGTATVTTVTNNNQRYVTINSVINVASAQEANTSLGGIYSLVTMFG